MIVNSKSEVINRGKFALADGIRRVRKSKGLNQADFGKLFGVSQGAISNWEMGADIPTIRYLQQLAEMTTDQEMLASLNKELSAITGIQSAVSPVIAAGTLRRVPVLNDPLMAGTPEALDEGEIREILDLPARWFPKQGEFYGLNVSGNSMSPIVNDNSLVIVDTSRRNPQDLIHHMIAVRERQGVTVKWLREDKGVFFLTPHITSREQPIRVMRKEGEFSLIGEVVLMIGTPLKPTKRK